MMYPEDILNESMVDPNMAAEYVLMLERKYVLRGKISCHPKIYRAALKAIAAVKMMSDDERALKAANTFLLNVPLKTIGWAKPEDVVLTELLQERDRLVGMPPIPIRTTAYEVSMPLQTHVSPRGIHIGLYATLESAERAVRNSVKNPPVYFENENKELVYYVIAQEAMDCYNLSPSDVYISVRKYNVDGILLSEWQNYAYNANGTIRCEEEKMQHLYKEYNEYNDK